MNQRAPAPVNPAAPAVPATAEVAGHFGEILQGRLGPDGPVALVTLPCPVFVTRVSYVPGPAPLVASDAVSAKALAAARALLAELGREAAGGRLQIRRPVPPGLGAGSSTAETLGAIRAVAAAHGLRLTAEQEARLCLAAEGAVDPLMHDGTVLFASRQGRVLRRMAPLPPLAVVGGFAGPPRPTDPRDSRFAGLGRRVEALERALAAGDVGGVAAMAEASAADNQRLRSNPAWEAVGRVGAGTGALGRVVSHSGAAIGLLYDAPPEGVAGRLTAAGVGRVTEWRLG